MRDEFADNLAHLCSYHSSIAEVCRRIGINRQQFNKYLSGQSRPSRANMRRICDFFGVTEPEILLEPSQLRNLVSVRSRPLAEVSLSGPMRHIDRLYRKSAGLDRYAGYYFRYYYSFSNPAKVMKSLGRIYLSDGRAYWKNIELIRLNGKGPSEAIGKYEGVVFFLTNRIHVLEYDTMQVNSMTQMTLYPSYRSRIGQLTGIQTGGPTRRGRRPAASKVLLEYLGQSIDLKKALYASGLFPPDDPAVPNGVDDHIRNTIVAGAFVLEAEEP
ncbi:MAG: helix-turn-helix transcriptional regulator [Silicimonas sp.]|jgi:transcriptional regulator with XRE-family HTH domain|uniref:helix-turn-helix domain-containing protein n=1 Tax=Roseitalea porphyridii TaxID=1852022 RepID=UPI0032EDC34A